MKKLFIIFFAMLSFSLWGQGGANADALLSSFSKKLKSYKSVELAFSFANDKVKTQNFTGTVLCSGNKFRLLTNTFEVYCDGRNKWFCNKETDEVIIQYVTDDDPADFTNNPLQFITGFQKGFTHKQTGKRMDGDKALVDIEFTPTDKKAAYASILLTLEEKTANPYTIRYTAKDGSQYGIRITRITPDAEAFDGYFAFPKHKYPNAEIIDLR